jgi:hypothetical protein
MQQRVIQVLRQRGFSGGSLYLNPTEPFNFYLDVGLGRFHCLAFSSLRQTICGLSICVLSSVLVHRCGCSDAGYLGIFICCGENLVAPAFITYSNAISTIVGRPPV